MHPITPICAETITPHIGRRVCVVMNDGTRHFGILRGFGDDKVYMERDGDLTLASTKKYDRKSRKKGKAQTKAFWGGPFGWGFGLAAFDVALIASLFLLPFLFF